MAKNMLYLYGDKNVLRALDESDFWKRQESEHTTVIQVVVTSLEEAYKKALNDFKLQMDETYTYIKRYLESAIRNDGQLNEETTAYVVKLITYCEKQSESFVALLQDILANSNAVKENDVAQTLINHIIRESEYYLGITQLITSQPV